MKTVSAVLVSDRDNCVTLTARAEPGDSVSYLCNNTGMAVTVSESIPAWHKAAIRVVEKGGLVYKYGSAIGVAVKRINIGEHVHVHNIVSASAL